MRAILITAYNSLHPGGRIGRNSNKKLMSYDFLKSVCRRNNMSFRDMRKKKRSDLNQAEVDEYIQSLSRMCFNS